MQKKAVILFSGGLDSTTCLAIAKDLGFIPYTLSFSYGQKHNFELEAAKRTAKSFKVKEHRVISVNLDAFGGSALTDKSIDVPNFQSSKDIPVTYVPARNTIFLSIALGYAEKIGASDIFIGINAVDYSGYPDCRPEFLKAFETVANLATKKGIEGFNFNIHAPLLDLDKADIIKKGVSLGVDYSKTTSCYRLDDQGRACGSCDSCHYRKLGFEEAGIKDPTIYSN